MARWVVNHNAVEIPKIGAVTIRQTLDGISSVEVLVFNPSTTWRTTLQSGFGYTTPNNVLEIFRYTDSKFSQYVGEAIVGYSKVDADNYAEYQWLEDNNTVFFLESVDIDGVNLLLRGRSPEILLKNERIPNDVILTGVTDNAAVQTLLTNYSTLVTSTSQNSTANTLAGNFKITNEDLYSAISRIYEENNVNFWVEKSGSSHILKTEDARTAGSTYANPNAISVEVGSTNRITKLERGSFRLSNQQRFVGASDSRFSGMLGDDGWTEATTNWTAAGSFNAVAADTTTKHVGSASVKFTRNATGNATADFYTGYTLKTSLTDYSQIIFWTNTSVAEDIVAVRCYTDATNYYEYTTTVSLTAATWKRNVIRFSDFTAVLSPTWNNINRIAITFSGGASTNTCNIDAMHFEAERSRPLQLLIPYRSAADKTDTTCSGYTDTNRFCYPVRNGCTGTSGLSQGCVHANATSSQTQYGVCEGSVITDTNVRDINQARALIINTLDLTNGYDSNAASWTGYRIAEIAIDKPNIKYRLGEWLRIIDTRIGLDITGRVTEIVRSWSSGSGETLRITIFNDAAQPIRTEEVFEKVQREMDSDARTQSN